MSVKKIALSLMMVTILAAGCKSGDSAPKVSYQVNPEDCATVTTLGFPEDFPEITDQGGSGNGEKIYGKGGNPCKNKTQHQSEVQASGKNPVIFIHGLGSNHTFWTEQGTRPGNPMRKMLRDKGYPEEAIWAFSYQGKNVEVNPDKGITDPSTTPARTNIKEVREFIDAVLEYTGANKVDLIVLSLGCHMARGYALGMTGNTASETLFFDPALRRIDKIGSLILLSGANYGMGKNLLGDWKSDGDLFIETAQDNFTMYDGQVNLTPGAIFYYAIYSQYDLPQTNYVLYGGGNSLNPVNTSRLGNAPYFEVPGDYVNDLDLDYSESNKGSGNYIDTNHIYVGRDPKIFRDHILPNLNKRK